MLHAKSLLATVFLTAVVSAIALGQPGMPANHPPLPGGHPPLPAGHPSINKPATQPVTVKLNIDTLQGTKDGPKIANEDVIVETMAINGQPQKTTVKLDAEGEAKVRNLVVAEGTPAVVTLVHNGVTFRAQSDPFTAAKPTLAVTVSAYETTDKEPAWTISMRHVMAQPMSGGLAVRDIIVVSNPTDRAWAGTPVAQGGTATQPALTRTTLSLSLPAGATNVKFFLAFGDETVTQFKEGKITTSAALVPGTMQFAVEYLLPIKDGKATVEINAPVAQEQVMLVAGEDGSKIKAEGFKLIEGASMGEMPVRAYQAEKVAANKSMVVQFEGLKEMKAPAGPDSTGKHGEAPGEGSGGSNSGIKVAAGIGAGVLVIASAAILVFKPAKKTEKSA